MITEDPSALTDERERHYERIRQRLERVAQTRVTYTRYVEVTDLGAAAAVVLSGSFAPWSVHDSAALDRFGQVLRAYEGPVLGICAGMQLQATFAGGSIGRAAASPETGFGTIDVLDDHGLLRGLASKVSVYKHHSDEIVSLPASFRVLARSAECAVEAMAASDRPWWGTQFHPEEFDARHPAGERVLRNFFELAGLRGTGRVPSSETIRE